MKDTAELRRAYKIVVAVPNLSTGIAPVHLQ